MIVRRFVVHASPLILLGRIDRLDLQIHLATEVIVPHSVLNEIAAGSHSGPEATRVHDTPELRPSPDIDIPLEIATWDLGAGESQVLALAWSHGGFEAVLDDREARRCASTLGVATTGTLGVVLRARQQGLCDAARPIIQELLREGLYLAPSLVSEALAEVGE